MECYPSPVFAKPPSAFPVCLPRRRAARLPSSTSSAFLTSPKSFPLIFFADPHPLTPVASIFYKNIGGQGAPLTFSARNTQNPVAHPPFFSTTCAMPLAQLLSFDNIPFSWGGVPPLRDLDSLSLAPHHLSPLFSYSCTLFCDRQKLNPFVFRRFHTLCQKHPGVGGASTPTHSAERGRHASAPANHQHP